MNILCKLFGHKHPNANEIYSLLLDYDTYLCLRCGEHLFTKKDIAITFGSFENFYKERKEFFEKCRKSGAQ